MTSILFASNNIADWSGSPSADTTAGRFDSSRVPYAIALSDNTTVGMAAAHPAPSGDTVWYGFRYYNPGPWGALEDGKFADVYDGSGNILAVLDVFNGELYVQVYGDTEETGSSYPMTSTGIVVIAVEVTVTAAGITCTIYIDGVAVSTATASNTASGKGVARQFVFNLSDTLPSGAAAFSEFVVAESNTSNMRITRLDPTTAGAYSQWSGTLTELADDDPATGISVSSTAQRNSANFQSLAATTSIAAVVAVASMAADAGGPQNAKQFLRKSATDYDGASAAIDPSLTFAVECWDVDPSTGVAWADEAAVNACEVGLLSVA